MKTSVIVLFILTLKVNPLCGQHPTTFSAAQIRRLDSIACQDVPKGAPGIATGIVYDGKIVYEKVAGFANLADSTLITKDSRFNLASNGKQFTALAILELISERKISLKDDIRKYLPTIYPKLKAAITIDNLLTHTSGVRDVYDLWSLEGITWWEHSFNNKDVLRIIERQKELNFLPGTRYLYSNTNYILLAEIIEKVTGQSFRKFTSQMFRKLNMPNTSFEDDYTTIRGPIAKAYFNFDTWTTYDWIWNVCGDGNLFSTLADQLHWEQLLQGKCKSNFKKEILARSQQLTGNSALKNYGFGLEFGTYKGLAYKFHEGATGAWKSTVIRFENRNLSIITLTNTGKATTNSQTRQMADVVVNLKSNASYIVSKPAKIGNLVSEEEMIGIYQNEENFTFQFEKKDTMLFLKRVGRNDVMLEREADNILHQTYDPDFKQEFKKNKKGEMTVTAYYTSHQPYTLTKHNVDWTNVNYELLNGKFVNDETGVFITIKFGRNKNYAVRIANQDSATGLLISPSKLLVDNYVFDIEMVNNSINTFLLSADRIERIKFRRVD